MDRKKFTELPIYKSQKRIIDTLNENQVVVIESPTGSGKTTQLPLILWHAGIGDGGVIGITQPRRIATVAVTDFMRKQEDISDRCIAYKMRFEDTTGPETEIKIMTDGTLLQELKSDPWLSAYKLIIIDEAHERSLNIDFILGLLKRIITERDDLKVIISSATINTSVFLNYFPDSKLLSIDAESYPVEIKHVPLAPLAESEVLVESVVEVITKHAEQDDYDQQAFLVFLSGEAQIRDTLSALASSSVGSRLYVLPLFGRLSSSEQDRVFDPAPAGKMKVVVATNIAETSITIDDITAVIDSGRAKTSHFTPRSSSSHLEETPVARVSSEQRKGRAGRTRAGVCYRLYSSEDFEKRDLYPTEEIFRTDLSEVVLRMAELGIEDYEGFDFISSPGKSRINAAVASLQRIDALDSHGGLTDLGKEMAPYPLYPRHARIILEAIRRFPSVISECICAVSFLTTNSPFVSVDNDELEAARAAQRSLSSPHGDFDVNLRILREYTESKDREAFCKRYYLDPRVLAEIYNINEQLSEIVSQQGVPVLSGGARSNYIAAICSGLIDTISVHIGGGRYRSLTLNNICMHPGSMLFGERPSCIVIGEIVKTTQMYARSVSPVKLEWLTNIDASVHQSLKRLSREGAEMERSGRGRRRDGPGGRGGGRDRGGRDGGRGGGRSGGGRDRGGSGGGYGRGGGGGRSGGGRGRYGSGGGDSRSSSDDWRGSGSGGRDDGRDNDGGGRSDSRRDGGSRGGAGGGRRDGGSGGGRGRSYDSRSGGRSNSRYRDNDSRGSGRDNGGGRDSRPKRWGSDSGERDNGERNSWGSNRDSDSRGGSRDGGGRDSGGRGRSSSDNRGGRRDGGGGRGSGGWGGKRSSRDAGGRGSSRRDGGERGEGRDSKPRRWGSDSGERDDGRRSSWGSNRDSDNRGGSRDGGGRDGGGRGRSSWGSNRDSDSRNSRDAGGRGSSRRDGGGRGEGRDSKPKRWGSDSGERDNGGRSKWGGNRGSDSRGGNRDGGRGGYGRDGGGRGGRSSSENWGDNRGSDSRSGGRDGGSRGGGRGGGGRGSWGDTRSSGRRDDGGRSNSRGRDDRNSSRDSSSGRVSQSGSATRSTSSSSGVLLKGGRKRDERRGGSGDNRSGGRRDGGGGDNYRGGGGGRNSRYGGGGGSKRHDGSVRNSRGGGDSRDSRGGGRGAGGGSRDGGPPSRKLSFRSIIGRGRSKKR